MTDVEQRETTEILAALLVVLEQFGRRGFGAYSLEIASLTLAVDVGLKGGRQTAELYRAIAAGIEQGTYRREDGKIGKPVTELIQ